MVPICRPVSRLVWPFGSLLLRDDMRKALAALLQRMATILYCDNHEERIEVVDEYGICRCRLSIITDDVHVVEATHISLPQGWRFEEYEYKQR